MNVDLLSLDQGDSEKARESPSWGTDIVHGETACVLRVDPFLVDMMSAKQVAPLSMGKAGTCIYCSFGHLSLSQSSRPLPRMGYTSQAAATIGIL